MRISSPPSDSVHQSIFPAPAEHGLAAGVRPASVTLMPAKKDQPPPDLWYFKQHKR
jgi:hypothetical protein